MTDPDMEDFISRAEDALGQLQALAEEFEDMVRVFRKAPRGSYESGLCAAYDVAADRIRRAIEGTR